jgi:glutamate carboxypeptidase
MANRADLLRRAERDAARMLGELTELVACESPSSDLAALACCAELAGRLGADAFGYPAERVQADGRAHLLWRRPEARVLLLGHYDTVWPRGTLAGWPLRVAGNRADGPGVFDMKAGIVLMLVAVRLLGAPGAVAMLLTADEETGSDTSRALIESQARAVEVVLVGEPSAEGGAPKVARKGCATYQLHVTGRAAHAGLEPETGVNATIEAARQVVTLAELADPGQGTTVTPTVLAGGTASNAVPEAASVTIDVRAWSRAEQDRIDAALRALKPVLPGASLTVTGGVHRPPLEEDLAMPLYEVAVRAAADVGVPLPPPARVGGGSDGNLTAALGVPTLDGLGAVGALPHGRGEHIDLPSLPGRAALLARIIEILTRQS